MTSMIERVAKRIYEKRNGPGCRAWAHIGKPHQEPYLGDAKAAMDEMRPLVDAMDQILDDMGLSGTAVCLAAKAQARIAFEPFLDPEAREFIMPLEDAERIAKEAGL